MRSLIVAVLAVAVVACGDRSNQVDFSADDIGPDVQAIVSRDGNLKLGLTRDLLYVTLSDSVRAEAREELESQARGGGIKGFFARLATRAVGKALNFRATYPVAEIRDIRWEDGGLKVEFMDPDRNIEGHVRINDDDESITEAFTEEDVLALSQAFHALKEEDAGAQR